MPEGIVFCGIWESLRGKKDEASKESGASDRWGSSSAAGFEITELADCTEY